MSQTKNQERLEIVNKRLAEINEKDVFPKRKQEQEPIIDEAPKTNHSPTTPNSGRLKTYLLRIAIVVGLFFIIKLVMDSNLIDSSIETTKDKEEVKVEAKINIPAKEEKLEYNFTFTKDENIIIFGKYPTEEEALEAKKIFTNKFVEFPVVHFYLPDNSNSNEEVYCLYLGPIKGKANANQWSKLIDIKNEILSF